MATRACAPRQRAARKRRRALISLTPLIDVVFILLVFFMLATSFLDWRSISLNPPAAGASFPSVKGAMLVEIREDGSNLSLRFSGRNLTLDALAGRLADRLVEKPDQRVLVKPHTGVVLQDVVLVLDRLSEVGVADLSLIRDRAR